MTDPQDIIFDRKFRLRRARMMLWRTLSTQIPILFMLIKHFFVAIFRVFVPKKPKNLVDKVVLITGAGNGIGKALALKLAQLGCHIVVVDVDYQAALKTVEEIIQKCKVKALAYKCDVSSHDDVMEMKRYVEKSFGYVDVLINNAGVLGMDVSLREKKPENIQRLIGVNLMSNFWVS